MNINVKMFTLLHNCEIFCFYILSRGIIHIFSESKRIVIPDKVIKIAKVRISIVKLLKGTTEWTTEQNL
jgi:hypothetical protein